MSLLSASFVCGVLLVFCIFLFKRCAKILYQSLTSPLRVLPGPNGDNILTGNIKSLFKAEFMELHEKWTQEHGETHAFHGLLNEPIAFTTDPKAVNHILTHTTEFEKAQDLRRQLSLLLGSGVLGAEGEQHKRQRRIMNPAFGPLQIRELTPVFLEKSMELRDHWAGEILKYGSSARIDVLDWLGRASLDIIGLAGFNYEFDALAGSANELKAAFSVVFESVTKAGFFEAVQSIFPPLRAIRLKRQQRAEEALAVMRRIGLQLTVDKKAEILAARASSEKQGAGRSSTHGRDLLTLLMKANMAVDIPESQRMDEEEVLGQIATFITAGHETTSTGATWCLFALTQAPEVQRKLRDELLQVSTDNPTMDELAALPYLDMVVKESLRLHAPVPLTDRVATIDTYIPLSKPFVDKYGQMHGGIRISKDNAIVIPILMMNQSKAIWGEDALDFKPERWENPPEAIGSIPGIWANLMTFLSGSHSCIGFRFAVIEMKALLFTLVRAFEFELAVPVSDIKKRSAIVRITRPFLVGEEEKGNQMPLIVKLYNRL